MTTSKLDRFKELARQATEKLDEHYNAPDIVPFTAKMVELVQGDTDNRFLYSKAIIGFWEQQDTDNHIIEFCCHVLGWQELKGYFNKEYNKAKTNEDFNALQSLRHIIKSFEPEWEDATDFYSDYFGN